MSSNRFLKIAKETVKKDKAIFDTLLEFEKTKKIRTKNKLTFTIDKSVASQFRKFCREHGYNMSAKIEQAMQEMMKDLK